MNCKNCNAVMRIDQERKVFVCPYCDSIEPFEGVSKAELQGMLHDAIQDVRQESMKEAKERLQREAVTQDGRSSGKKALDVVILVAQIVLCLFFAIFMIGFFIDYVALGFVSMLQLGLMISAMILKAKYRKTGVKKWLKLKNACLTGVCILVVFWFMALMAGSGSSSGGSRDATWPTQGLGSELPVPEGTLKYAYSSKADFSATVKDSDGTGFKAFIEGCKEQGYVIDVELDDDYYHAYNEADDELTVRRWSSSKEFNIKLDKGIVLGEYQWPKGELAESIPKLEAEKSSLVKLSSNNVEIYVGDLTRQQFIQYIMDLQEAGFEGSYYDNSNHYSGKKGNISISVEFKRERLAYIDVYESSH